MTATKLKRSVSLPLVTFYGLGTILGAGIYVLIGKVAELAGLYAPFAFLVAAIVAGFTAYSYGELSSRYPKSSGESYYVQTAFNQPWLAAIVGWLVILTGIISAATITTGFVGYLNLFVTISPSLAIILLVTSLTALAIWGITESAIFVMLVTLIGLLGLIFVIVIAGGSLATLPERWPELIPGASSETWSGIFLGGFLAFYAFIGFEDMVNIAEEVKSPSKNLPLAIALAFIIATILYLIVALIAVLAMPIKELAASNAPLASLLATKSTHSAKIISFVSLIAVVNGALVQIIMASRVIYGMSCQQLLPTMFTKLNSFTQTPVIATLLTGIVVLVLALWFPLVTLAKATSFVVLAVFLLVNCALIKVKKSKRWIPIVGAGLCIWLMSNF